MVETAAPAFGYLRAPLLACIMEIDFSGRLESRRGRLSAEMGFLTGLIVMSGDYLFDYYGN